MGYWRANIFQFNARRPSIYRAPRRYIYVVISRSRRGRRKNSFSSREGRSRVYDYNSTIIAQRFSAFYTFTFSHCSLSLPLSLSLSRSYAKLAITIRAIIFAGKTAKRYRVGFNQIQMLFIFL